ncbi:MAG TPA: hypothetical protein DCY13_02755 [Verrucomicrobiales bacterium]|nr:hypothetical protein [Verrucomicrobiales bacterium]
MAALAVALGLLAVRPDWHSAFHQLPRSHNHAHDDEGSPHGHEHDFPAHDDAGCAIELFAGGQVEFLDAVTGPLLPPQIAFSASTSSLAGLSAHLGFAPPGRAPPSLS